MAQIWKKGWTALMVAGLRGPSLYYYDCPDQCCYGKGNCNPPDQLASWQTFQECLDATADPSCRFSTSVIFGLGETEIKEYTHTIVIDATLLWKTFPGLFMDPGRPMRVSGFNKKNCVDVIPCHETDPPIGECIIPDEDLKPNENAFEFDSLIEDDIVWFATNHWVAQRPSMTLLPVSGVTKACDGTFELPINVTIPIKVPFKGGDKLPNEVLNNPLPW